MRRHALATAALALACAAAHSQTAKPAPAQYTPTPVNRCDYFAATYAAPEFSSVAPLLVDLQAKLPESRAACEQAVRDEPKTARLWGHLARLRAMALDGPGALEAARKGAELGSPTAEVIIGVMYADGVQLERDYPRAREHFMRAAKAGSAYAHFNLGVLAANGWGVLRDDAEAAAALRRAADGRDPLAMQILAQRYDAAGAERWLKKAAESLYADAAGTPLRIANPGAVAPDAAALVAWYQARAAAGEAWAEAYLGLLHEAGQWLAKDYAAAAARYRAAGEAGYVPAQHRMANFYREGKGVPRDEEESRRWAFMQQTRRCEALERAAAEANPCDRLAADRHDPQRMVEGLDSYCTRLFAGRAVSACTAAVKASPKTVRYHTQLARALAHTGRMEEARREASVAARAGSSAAMILLGVMSQRGLGTQVDEKAALAWYRRAAEAGDQRGVALVMTSAFGGIGVEKGSAEANALMAEMRPRMAVRSAPTMEEMAAKGNPREQHNLAAELERQKRYDEALQWYERAAAQGFRPSQLNLAQMYERGIGVAQDTMEARRRYRALAAQGDGEARYRAARLAADAADWAEAIPAYERLARDDDMRGLLDLGELYEQGRGVKQDGARAASLYERAAERSLWARYKLGVVYVEGKLVPQDYARARAWLERAARDDNREALNNLGNMYDRGLGVKPDALKARDYYFAALKRGEWHAKGNLERFYAEGRGAPAGSAALDWYREGAEHDIAAAQYRLGVMYLKGEGVGRDDKLALDWLLKAARQSHPEARKLAGELLHAAGRELEAMELGNEAAARALSAEMAAKSGRPDAAVAFMAQFLEYQRRMAALPPPPRAEGLTLAVPADPVRTIAVRVASAGSVQGIGVDPSYASPDDIIRWFPEIDGRKK
jgi:TPR repeat protein